MKLKKILIAIALIISIIVSLYSISKVSDQKSEVTNQDLISDVNVTEDTNRNLPIPTFVLTPNDNNLVDPIENKSGTITEDVNNIENLLKELDKNVLTDNDLDIIDAGFGNKF